MIIGSIVVAMQMGYIQKKDLGFDREQILMLALNDTAIVNNVTAFMEKIERHPSVEGTALSTTAPGRFYGKQVMTVETNDGEMGEKAFNNCFVSYDYMEVMGLTLVISFTVLIIFIAALGLLGLSSFMTAKRTRETGVRKVMGASQNQILYLFLSQFSRWVIISNLVAWPLSYFVMKNWLQNFTYRIDFPFWTFIISLLLSLTIAVITVSWQSIKASRMNPAASIRVE